MDYYEMKGHSIEELYVEVHEKDLYVHIQAKERAKSKPRGQNT